MATKLETLSDKELGALRKATEILERLEAPTAAAGPEAT
jgi:hypothetical protein